MIICVKINNSCLQEIKNFAKVCCSVSREGSSHKGNRCNSLRYIGVLRGLVAPRRIGIWWYRRCDGRWILCHNVDKFFLAYFFICYFYFPQMFCLPQMARITRISFFPFFDELSCCARNRSIGLSQIRHRFARLKIVLLNLCESVEQFCRRQRANRKTL
jgi:hypothetical protein